MQAMKRSRLEDAPPETKAPEVASKEDTEDVEEKEGEDDEPPPPRPTPGMSLRDRLKAKKGAVKKK